MGYSEAILSVVEKHGWQIFYLHLDDVLTKCQRVKVPTQENEEKIPNKGAITKQIALRFLGEEIPEHPSSTSTEDDDEDGEEATAEKKNIENKGEEEKTESVHIESDKDKANMTQTYTLATIASTLKSITSLTEQEHAIHQLIDDLRKIDTDDEEEVPINQLKRKRYK
ncbi:hypothetical protein PVK06_020522 [Gossypium arboreum]|uniref:Uncharacterized protein n=1 Tax=Gossypium arboreum TaxID=29729 RepID=A0ABR0PML0_GOSAR|nr:hypothetical protein PVK06_020522 [Gossypium arboreum]